MQWLVCWNPFELSVEYEDAGVCNLVLRCDVAAAGHVGLSSQEEELHRLR